MDEEVKRYDDGIKKAQEAVDRFTAEETKVRDRASEAIKRLEADREREVSPLNEQREAKNKEKLDLEGRRKVRLDKLEQDVREARG